MDIHDKTRIRINTSELRKKVIKATKENYFILTCYYMVIYTIISTVIIYGVNYFGTSFDVNSGLLVSLMLTVATMSKKLKEDIVSNYWKLKKMKPRQVRGKK